MIILQGKKCLGISNSKCMKVKNLLAMIKGGLQQFLGGNRVDTVGGTG